MSKHDLALPVLHDESEVESMTLDQLRAEILNLRAAKEWSAKNNQSWLDEEGPKTKKPKSGKAPLPDGYKTAEAVVLALLPLKLKIKNSLETASKKAKLSTGDEHRAKQLVCIRQIISDWENGCIKPQGWGPMLKEAVEVRTGKLETKSEAQQKRSAFIKHFITGIEEHKEEWKALKSLSEKDAYIQTKKDENPNWEEMLSEIMQQD